MSHALGLISEDFILKSKTLKAYTHINTEGISVMG